MVSFYNLIGGILAEVNPPNVARLYKKEPGYEAKVSLHSLVLRTSHKLVAQSWQRFLVVPDNK